MAARTTAEVLEQLERFVPPEFAPLRPILALYAAELRAAEVVAYDTAASSTVEGAEGVFLTALARGYGVERLSGEADATLRSRLRNVSGAVTRPAILDAVNLLLADYTEDEAVMVEWFEEPFADYHAFADYHLLVDGPNAFVLILPPVGDEPLGSSFADVAYADFDAYPGDGETHPVYSAIGALVQRLKAAGVLARLFINYDGDFRG